MVVSDVTFPRTFNQPSGYRTNPMDKIQPKTVWISLFAYLLFSSTILPFVIPPFSLYTLRDLLEVLLW